MESLLFNKMFKMTLIGMALVGVVVTVVVFVDALAVVPVVVSSDAIFAAVVVVTLVAFDDSVTITLLVPTKVTTVEPTAFR